MNIEPCVRLGIRISPKIRENPADNKNNRPPNVTLLTVSSSQNVISLPLRFPATDFVRSGMLGEGRACRNPSVVFPDPARHRPRRDHWIIRRVTSALSQRRIVTRVNRMSQELLFRPGPELTHVFIGLDGLVPDLEAVFGALRADTPDVERADHVVEVVELERTARRVGQADRFERAHELFFVAG